MLEPSSLLQKPVSRRRLGALGLGVVAGALAAGAGRRRVASSDVARHRPNESLPSADHVYALPSLQHGDGIRPGCSCARCLGTTGGDIRQA